MGDSIITVNVGGRRFEIGKDVLSRFPESTLGRLTSYTKKEVFFQRPTPVFKSVLGYHQTGHLHLPASVCLGAVQEELEFWGFTVDDVEPCCRRALTGFHRQQHDVYEFEKETAPVSTESKKQSTSAFSRGRRRLWRVMDQPFSSTIAKIYFVISCFVIVAATLLTVLGTEPYFKGTLQNEHWKEYFGQEYFDKHYDKIRLADKGSDPVVMKEITERHNKTAGEILGNFSLPTNVHVKNENMELVSYICTGFFTLELLLRLCCCPSLFRFFRSLLNIIDVLAVVSALVKIIVEQLSAVEKFEHSYLDILEGMLVLRVLRLFHLTKHITGARVLVYAFKSSFREVGFMALLVLITSIVFGTVEYYVDSDRMQSIPEACWWAVITMTTVGYGDVTPSNAVSKSVGVICACMGILVLAITMPLFVNNFITFYSIAKETSDKAKAKTSSSEPRTALSTVHPVVLHRNQKENNHEDVPNKN
ncbi:potassium voltage-gated channel subfamily V member 1-like [Haliotis rubra]|uniref:potassium voltage-gated channel subfamily V member 1-like n=1 Tax=Haliotis rubra TaxID=36100 RepID=UPI001EE59406|nr:potassium voltage-gated channel subfamily V member 1-like [Haliotis rubra]XP_046579641.1 potassium voltage-gated channel subfamily V member 1-like [Haliotis rubra]